MTSSAQYINTATANTYYQMSYPPNAQQHVVYRYNPYQQPQPQHIQHVQTSIPQHQPIYYSTSGSGYVSAVYQQGSSTPVTASRMSQSSASGNAAVGNGSTVITQGSGLVSTTPQYTTSTSINALNQAHHVYPYRSSPTYPTIIPAGQIGSGSRHNSASVIRSSIVGHQQPTHLTIAAIPDSQQHHSLRVLSSAVAGDGKGPRIITTIWEDENTLCYQVEANGVSVVRRADNDMINGTKLLNVTKMTRGKRDGILRSEKYRKVVKIGSMHLKGVWIPFERALFIAKREKIVDLLYPLFVRDITSVLKTSLKPSSLVIPMQDNTTVTSKIYQLPASNHVISNATQSSSVHDGYHSPTSHVRMIPKIEEQQHSPTSTSHQYVRLPTIIKREDEERPILKSSSSTPPLIKSEDNDSSWDSRRASKSDVTKISSLINSST